MIPQRFVTEYPERCGQLLAMLEPQARKHDLVGSFALLVASAAFTIPFARMTEKQHPAGKPEAALLAAIEALKKAPFVKAPFWKSAKPGFFRYAKIVTNPENQRVGRTLPGCIRLNRPRRRTAIRFCGPSAMRWRTAMSSIWMKTGMKCPATRFAFSLSSASMKTAAVTASRSSTRRAS